MNGNFKTNRYDNQTAIKLYCQETSHCPVAHYVGQPNIGYVIGDSGEHTSYVRKGMGFQEIVIWYAVSYTEIMRVSMRLGDLDTSYNALCAYLESQS